MKERNKRVFTKLSEVEYENFKRFLNTREQPATEYVLMALAVLLNDEEMVIEKRTKVKGPKQLLTFRCSNNVFLAVAECAQKHNCSKADVVAMAIKEAIKG